MSDLDRVKAAMQMVAKHKLPSRELRVEDFDILAETALKAMWLIEVEKRDNGVVLSLKEPHDAIKYGLEVCPQCGSGDVRWCGISVRPYCNECGHWGRPHHGTAKEAIKRWNDQSTKGQDNG